MLSDNDYTFTNVRFTKDSKFFKFCIARIGRRTYYDNIKTNQIFAQRMTLAKKDVTLAAKRAVVKAINNGDARISMQWLMKRDPGFRNPVASGYEPDPKTAKIIEELSQ